MPRVKLDYVVSFSSEDSENPASNLLAYEVSKKKWLCNTGEPSCSVVLQLTRAVQISTVHIGAYHAALVEVLVGRSETPNDQYEVLVPSSVFLSPMDSRRGSGVERVRSFSADQLAPARSQRWDRVRVVCSQPYNKHCKYGLSFVHIFESEDKHLEPEPTQPAAPAVPARVAVVGNYSSDEDDFRPGELFAKHLQRTSEAGTSKNTEAQIRQASSQALRNITDSSTKLVKTPISKTSSHRPSQANDFNVSRERKTLMYTDDDDRPNAKIDSVVQRHKNEKEQETKKKEAVQNMFKKDKHASRLEAASKNFKEFLDDDRKDLNSSRSKESSRDNDKSSKDDRNKDSRDNDKRNKDNLDHYRSNSSKDDERRNKDNFNNSRSNDSRDSDRRNKDNLDNSRSKDSRDDDTRNKGNLNNSRSKDNFRDNDRRNKDDEKASQSRIRAENGPRGDSRKRQHSDDRQNTKDVLRAGPVSTAPHTLLRHVVFALSGYENPRRGRIRDAAVAMGARFERDWNPACTHLICAFPNTPKLRTVRSSSQGSDCIAVLGEWVEQCCEKRRLLPWQWFATEPKKKVAPPAGWDEDKSASECDTDDEIEKVLRKQKKQRMDRTPSPQPHTSKVKSPEPHSSRERSPKPQTSRERSPKPQTSRDRSPKPQTSRERSPKQQTTGERSPKSQTSRERSPKRQISRDRSPKLYTNREQSPSRDRSPHRKEKSPKQSKNSLNYSNMSSDSDVAFVKDERIQANITIDSGDSTDEEKPAAKEKVDKKKVLPDFFEGYTFVIDDGVEDAGFDKELLSRYVTAYGGLVIDASQVDSDSEISFVLCAGATTRTTPGRCRRVRCAWVWRCHRRGRLCDVEEYAL